MEGERILFAQFSPVTRRVSLHGTTPTGTISTSASTKDEAAERLAEGGLLVDCEDVDDDVFAEATIKGPMVDVKQRDDYQTTRVPDYMLSLGGLEGSFKVLGQLQKRLGGEPDNPGPLDTLSPRAYARYYARLGAVIYEKRGSALVQLREV
jgi:hypothetical protein